MNSNKTTSTSQPTMPADFGVNLIPDPHGQLIVHPVPAPTPGLVPMPLPKLPSQHLALWADALQAFWCQHRRPLAMLLYLDFVQGSWRAVVPSQRITRAGSSWRLNSEENPWRIGATERLAGSVQSRCVGDPGRLVEELPDFHGLHLITDTTMGPGGQSLWAYFCQSDQVYPAELAPLVHLNGWDWLSSAFDQLHVVDGHDADEHDEDCSLT